MSTFLTGYNSMRRRKIMNFILDAKLRFALPDSLRLLIFAIFKKQKLARVNNLSESAKKEGFAAIIAVLIMASAFLVVGWFHVLGILAFLLTIFYIVGVSIWFIFGKKMTDKWRLEKKFEKVKFVRMALIYQNSRDKT